MTFYELIRTSLLKDAEKHPFPMRACANDPPPDNGKKRDEPDKQADP